MTTYTYRKLNGERGSAMVLAIFVLALLASIGVGLLFLADRETKMSRANLRAKKAFFLSEAGLENGRITLANTNVDGPFDDDLLAAAGPNLLIDFDPNALQANYDSSGSFTGFSGYGDDVPLRATTQFGEGSYIAFLGNDAVDIVNLGPATASVTDTNQRIVVSAAAVGPERSTEIVQAIVEIDTIIPQDLPATITLLGEDPNFYSGNSRPKKYVGDDCGVTGGLFMPVVGTVSTPAEAAAEKGKEKNPTMTSGGMNDYDVIADLTDLGEPTVSSMLAPEWTDCHSLVEMVETLREVATVTCPPGNDSACLLPAPNPQEIVFVDGDWDAGATIDHQGMLVVTGTLTMHGRASWAGGILVIGEGQYRLNGAGDGIISGGMVVADVAGPDDIYGTADDCTGPNDGFDEATYDERGGGNAQTRYCSSDLDPAYPDPLYPIVGFLQR